MIKLDSSFAAARKAIRLDDQDAVARFALERSHLARAEYDGSITELEHAIELNSGWHKPIAAWEIH